MKNLHFDLGFMMGIISMPFHSLEDADIGIKKKLFTDVGAVVERCVKEYEKVDDE